MKLELPDEENKVDGRLQVGPFGILSLKPLATKVTSEMVYRMMEDEDSYLIPCTPAELSENHLHK